MLLQVWSTATCIEQPYVSPNSWCPKLIWVLSETQLAFYLSCLFVSAHVFSDHVFCWGVDFLSSYIFFYLYILVVSRRLPLLLLFWCSYHMLFLQFPIPLHGFNLSVWTEDFHPSLPHPVFTEADLQIPLLSIQNNNDPVKMQVRSSQLCQYPPDSIFIKITHIIWLWKFSLPFSPLLWTLTPITPLHRRGQLTLFRKDFPDPLFKLHPFFRLHKHTLSSHVLFFSTARIMISIQGSPVQHSC